MDRKTLWIVGGLLLLSALVLFGSHMLALSRIGNWVAVALAGVALVVVYRAGNGPSK